MFVKQFVDSQQDKYHDEGGNVEIEYKFVFHSPSSLD